jgi:hypothetical protein
VIISKIKVGNHGEGKTRLKKVVEVGFRKFS